MTGHSVVDEKARWRKEMLEGRESLDPMRKMIYDESVCEELHKLIYEKGYHSIHTYIPMGHEIFLEPLLIRLLDNPDIHLYAPKALKNGVLENRPFTSFMDLEEGVLGTRYPSGDKIYDGSYDLIIVPGLAFDKEGYRLGYGRGYYDRFLSQQTNAYKLGVCYPFQLIHEVPREEHDQKLDRVLTLSSF